jgi:hypothetical protein
VFHVSGRGQIQGSVLSAARVRLIFLFLSEEGRHKKVRQKNGEKKTNSGDSDFFLGVLNAGSEDDDVVLYKGLPRGHSFVSSLEYIGFESRNSMHD